MASAAAAQVTTKLAAARARLILDRPFIGALVMHLPFTPAEQVASIATDARRLYFNPGYIEGLSFRQTQFVLAHAAMHCALGHFARRGHRLQRRWDLACDHAVNLLLAEEGMEAPPGALHDMRFRGLAAEEIYPLIGEDSGEAPLDRHLFGSGGEHAAAAVVAVTQSGQEPGQEPGQGSAAGEGADSAFASEDETWSDAATHARRHPGAAALASVPDTEALAQAWQMRLAAAAQQARHAGRLGASWQRLLERFIEPRLPWRALLARYLSGSARDDYSFQRLSRREGEALLPRLSCGQIELYVILDTSGSIGDAELAAFAAEIDALKGQVRAHVTVHACDSALAPEGPWIFEAWEHIALPERLAGGGSTDFAPAFDWIARASLRPDVLLYFTDAEGDFPPAAPPFPVIWLVKGRAEVPWGERVQLND